MRKTSAWPLALAWSALIVYASLYPFVDWRDQGVPPWAFLVAPWPSHWSAFDVVANVLGYGPLGLLLGLSALRGALLRPGLRAALGLSLACAALSLAMEALQSYLPSRVPSLADFLLNSLGAALGVLMALALEPLGAVAHWNRVRERWFAEDARGALVLLALWPVALLFPAAVPFGLGQVFERLESALAQALQDTPFLDWLPVREIDLQPLVPVVELSCVTLGLLIPCLLGYCVTPTLRRRAGVGLGVLAVGVGVTALSAALSYGPTHAWAWLSQPVRVGLVLGALLALVCLSVPRRSCAALLLLALAVHLSLLNQAPASAYFWQTLQTWEQGRFIRFHGLAQWLGWLWPYAALLYVLLRLSRVEPKTRMPA